VSVNLPRKRKFSSPLSFFFLKNDIAVKKLPVGDEPTGSSHIIFFKFIFGSFQEMLFPDHSTSFRALISLSVAME